MPEPRMPQQLANDIYDILVEECGAYDGDDWSRQGFVHWVVNGVEGHEFRFGGKLGFGGKLWFFSNSRQALSVSCYAEDENKDRQKMIAKTNERLAQLAQQADI